MSEPPRTSIRGASDFAAGGVLCAGEARVAGGEWVSRGQLPASVDARPDDFMPDTVALLGPWLRDHPCPA